MKSFFTNGTGSQQTLTESETEAIPIYDDLSDAESDLANLTENQIIGTKDNSLVSTPAVDEVKAGVFNPLTSNAVAESLSYSTTEQKTGGVWLDGKPIYRRVIPTGALPNNSTMTINSPIQNLDFITDFRGIAVNSEHSQQQFPNTNINLYFVGYESPQKFGISTEFDASDYSGYIIVEYTKTTD